MTFISQPMDDHVERETVPEGRYTIRIVDYKIKEREDGVVRAAMFIHEIDGEPDAKAPIFFMNLVLPEDDSDKKYWKLAFQKGYINLFNGSWEGGGFEPDALIGQAAEVDLTKEVLDNGDEVNRFEVRPVT